MSKAAEMPIWLVTILWLLGVAVFFLALGGFLGLLGYTETEGEFREGGRICVEERGVWGDVIRGVCR